MALRTLDEHDLGISWVVDERMRRASHALAVDGRVWLVDPVDEPEALARAVELGPPAGVLQLLDRHRRDGAAIAQRLGVDLHVLPDAVPGTPLRTLSLVDVPGWHEVGLWWEAGRALVVPEAVGTAPLFTAGTGPAGVHPLLRLPGAPRRLRDVEPLHLLVGHGAPLHGPGTPAALRHAIARARRDVPRLVLSLPKLATS